MNHASKIKRRKVHPVKWTTWRLRIPHIQIGQDVCNLRADWKPSQTRCNPDPFSGANERSQPRNCKWLMSYEARKQNPPRRGAPQIEQASGWTIPERIIQKPDVGLAKNLPQTNRRQRRMALSCQHPFTPRIRTHVAPEKSLYLGSLYAKTQYFLSFSAYFWRRSWLSPFLYIPLHRQTKKTQHYETWFTTYISIYPLRRRSGSALLRNLYWPARTDPRIAPCSIRRNSDLRRRPVRNRLCL